MSGTHAFKHLLPRALWLADGCSSGCAPGCSCHQEFCLHLHSQSVHTDLSASRMYTYAYAGCSPGDVIDRQGICCACNVRDWVWLQERMRQQQERLAKKEEAAAEKEKKAAERKRAQEEKKK